MRVVEHYGRNVQLQKMVDADRTVKDAENKLALLDEKERKLKKDIRKGVSFFRQKRGGDICLLRQQLEQVIASKEAAERALSDTRAEMEVVKMFRFRHGMQGIADAYRTLASGCHAIFSCHREITEMVPAISNQDVRRMVYEGMPVTRDRVDELRRCLDTGLALNASTSSSSRRRSEPIRSRVHPSRHGTPPPPYSPTAPPDQTIPSLPVQRSHASDSQLMYHQGTQVSNGSSVTVSQTPATVTSAQNTQQAPPNITRVERHRRSMPCSGCGRANPEVPTSIYPVI